MSHTGSIHLYSTLTVMLYSSGGCIRACIITSPDSGLEILFEGCASMLIGGGGAIYRISNQNNVSGPLTWGSQC